MIVALTLIIIGALLAPIGGVVTLLLAGKYRTDPKPNTGWHAIVWLFASAAGLLLVIVGAVLAVLDLTGVA